MKKNFYYAVITISIIAVLMYITIYHIKCESNFTFKESGSYWDVDLRPDASTSSHSENINKATFTYKGNIEDLRKIKRICFAVGNSRFTQAITISDISIKKKLISEGLYKGNFTKNTPFIEFGKLTKKSFDIQFDDNIYYCKDKSNTGMKDKIDFQITWGDNTDKNDEFSDRIQIDTD